MANTFKFGNGEWAVGKETVLAYNDENNNFKPLPFSFDRASTATVVNKNGLIETVGANEPRVDYKDSTDGAMLLEPQRTNSLPYSNDFSQSNWVKGTNVTINSNSTTSPDGTTNATTLLSASGTDRNGDVLQEVISGLTSSTSYTFSIYIDLQSSTQATIYFRDASTGAISSETISNKTGFNRVDVTRTLGASTNAVNLYIGNTNSDVYIYGAQLEQGSYATSYIPTSGSAVTRSAESCSNGGNEQVINSTEGVLYLETKPITDNYSNNGNAFSSQINLSDGNLNNGVNIRFRGANLQCLYYNGSSYQAVLGLIGISVQNYKIAFSYKENEFKMFVNGLLVQQVLTGTIGTFTLSKITFDNSNGVNPFYGNVKDIKVYNTALSDSELQALTSN